MTTATVRCGLLGHVEVVTDGGHVDLGHAKQRAVLAVLLLAANHPVSVDQLLDRVWGDHAPARARDALYGYLYRLRRALGPVDGVDIVRRAGYVLVVEPATVDLWRFRDLVRQAREAGAPRRSLALLDEALGLWRGDPLAGLDSPWLNAAREGLAQERRDSESLRVDLALRCGRHTQLVAELHERAERYPLDEGAAGQLMLALYRSGRTNEALEHFQLLRSRLLDELGTDPNPALVTLHQRILAADPELARPQPELVHDRVPHQLPSPPRLFVGRDAELRALDLAMADPDPVAVTVLSGLGGTGKTWLALRWGYDNADRFPDGQLYVNLRGFDPTEEPVPPSVAIRAFLAALGVAPEAMPADLDGQTALFRTLTAGKRLLVIADNARDSAQVTPLLPGSTSAAVLITSRHRLTGLVTTHGARLLTTTVLGEDDARELLTRHIGADRVTAEPDAVATLLACCAGLPLAIGIAAARIAAQPGLPLAGLADELRDDLARLDGLDTGELTASLRAVFSSSYAALPPAAARAFRLLGLVTGPDISLPAAASLLGEPVARTRVALRALVDSHLLYEHVPGRFRKHDLVHLYALDRAGQDEPEPARVAALSRLVHFYLHTAYAGDRVLYPERPPVEADPLPPDCVPQPLADRAATWDWFTAEHSCLRHALDLTVRQGWHSLTWQLAWALTNFHWRGGHNQDAIDVWEAGLNAAQRLDQPAVEALASRLLGFAYVRAGRPAEAMVHLERAATLFEAVGDRSGLAHSQRALSTGWIEQGNLAAALAHAEKAAELFRETDDPIGYGSVLNSLGWINALLGRFEPARTYCEQALELSRRHGYRENESATLDSLGYIAARTDRPADALQYYTSALELSRRLSNSNAEAATHDWISEVHTALGDTRAAVHHLRQAIDLYRTQGRRDKITSLHRRLATLCPGEAAPTD